MYRSSVLVIPKANLSKAEIEKIHNDLSYPNPVYHNTLAFSKYRPSADIPQEILFYQEIDGNLILPRNYPVVLKHSYHYKDIEDRTAIGDPIRNLYFTKELRQYQNDYFKTIDWNNETDICMCCPCGHGKCLGKGTKLLMYDGSIKKVEDVVVGDLLMGDDSTPRTVLSLARGKEQMYWVHQNKGESYRVNESHILSLRSRKTTYDTDVIDISVKEYLDKNQSFKNTHLGYKVPVEYKYKQNLIDPYFLGAWLGDGDSAGVIMTTDEKDTPLIDYYYKLAEKHKVNIHYRKQKNNNASSRYSFSTERGKKNPLLKLFQREGLIKNKRIPNHYITTSRNSRLKLLAGLIDTDGTYSNHSLSITQKRHNLIEDIKKLCWSLGFRTSLYTREVKGITYYTLGIMGNSTVL